MGIFSKLFGGSKNSETKIVGLGKLGFLEVDMHNHLLPGIDDGSESVEQSLELIKGLQSLGIKKSISTPHIIQGVHPNTKDTINNAHNQLSQFLKEQESSFELFAAAEHMIDDGLPALLKDDGLCVIPGGYVLIEMSYLAESRSLFQTIFDIQSLGYKPILAHPERYGYYHMNFDMYKKIKNTGCMLQLNLLSISRYYGVDVKSTALTLIKSGMYDFVGTDMHHDRHLRALKEIAEKYPVRDLLKTCTILNPSLLDVNDGYIKTDVG